jgi:hypothetical protein
MSTLKAVDPAAKLPKAAKSRPLSLEGLEEIK